MTHRHLLPSGAFSCRILGLVLSPRWGGMVVVDGYGIAPVPMTPAELKAPARDMSFRTIELREAATTIRRSSSIERHLSDAILRYSPTLAVLAVHRKESRDHPRMRLVAREFLARHGIPTIERKIVDARKLFLGRVRGRRRDDLSERLAKDFFPELSARIGENPERRRYERHAWNALALALGVLAEFRPISAITLSQPGALLSPTFKKLLTHAANSFRG